MAAKTTARIATIAATICIAGLPLAISAPASAITKPEPGATEPTPLPVGVDSNLDLVQLGAGALTGISMTVAGFAAASRLRRHKPVLPLSTSVMTDRAQTGVHTQIQP